MDISVPDTVVFSTEHYRGNRWQWAHYCFAHAVLRALEGEQIKVKLEDEPVLTGCADCVAFGKPQTHELGSLRRP